jgi:hypothetical protein
MAQDFISALFGAPPDYSNAFTPQQTEQMRSNALAQGGIGALVAMLGASGQTTRPISTGQALAGALGAGFGGYQSSFDNTLKQMLTAQQLGEYKRKQEQRGAFEKAIAEATRTVPVGTGLTQTGEGSQARMLADQTAAFGEEGTMSTLGALQSNVNLPTRKTVDFDSLVSAITQIDPVEAAKLMVKTDARPEGIKSFEAFLKMTPEQQAAFKQFKQLSTPSTTNVVNLTEKGLNEIDKDRVGEFSSAASSARTFAQNAGAVNLLLKGKSGGEVVKIGTELAKNLGFSNEQVTANDLANSLAVRGAVGVRQPGSGSTSDIEFKAYLSAFPSLSNSEQGRELMVIGAEAFAKRNALLSDKARELYKAGKYSDVAIAEYDNSLGPVIDQKKIEEVAKASGGGKPAAAKPTRRSF